MLFKGKDSQNVPDEGTQPGYYRQDDYYEDYSGRDLKGINPYDETGENQYDPYGSSGGNTYRADVNAGAAGGFEGSSSYNPYEAAGGPSPYNRYSQYGDPASQNARGAYGQGNLYGYQNGQGASGQFGNNDRYNGSVPYGSGGQYGGQAPYGNGGQYGGQAPYGNGGQYGGQVPYGSGGQYGGQPPYGNSGPYNGQGNYGGGRPAGSGSYGNGSPYGGANAYGGRRGGRGTPPPGGGAAGVPQPYRNKKKGHRGPLIALLVLLALLAAAAAFVFGNLGRIDRTKLKEVLTNAGVTADNGYTTYVLYGVDSRDGQLTKDCHSDMILVLALNKKTKELKMASVYRDTYLDNTNGEYRKATECYFYGGPERSVNMLNKNLDLDIQDYVSVNFQAVVQVIDLLGGIDLEITEEEMNYINGYCVETSQVTGVTYTPLTSAGYVHLDGVQAMAYTRIRYTEGWDYKRTERQRQVVMLAYKKAVEKGPVAMAQIAMTMLPNISTSMSTLEVMSLVASIGTYKIGDQTGFPFNSTAADLPDAGDCVVPVNLAANVSQLHEFLYGENGYQPSQTVQDISATISANTGIY